MLATHFPDLEPFTSRWSGIQIRLGTPFFLFRVSFFREPFLVSPWTSRHSSGTTSRFIGIEDANSII